MSLLPPVTIDKLMLEWVSDCKIDPDKVDLELLKIPNCHAKYLNILSYHRHIIHKLDKEYKKTKDFKHDYFSGHFNNKEDLEKYNLEPIQRVMSNPEIARKLEADKDLTEILLKKVGHQEICDYCEIVLKELNSRSWQLRSFIDYQRYIKGL